MFGSHEHQAASPTRVTSRVMSIRMMGTDQGTLSWAADQGGSVLTKHGIPTVDHARMAVGDLISIPETARRIGLHADTLYRLCRTGRFPPAIQIGARWMVSVPRLQRYLHGEGADE